MAPHTIFLVTSAHPGWTDLRAWLKAMPGADFIREIGESRNLDAAVRAITELPPSLVIAPFTALRPAPSPAARAFRC